MRATNEALLAKLCWRIVNNPEALWPKSSSRNTCLAFLLVEKRIVQTFGQLVGKEALFFCKALNGPFIMVGL